MEMGINLAFGHFVAAAGSMAYLGYFPNVVLESSTAPNIFSPHYSRLYSIQVSTPSPSQVLVGENIPQAGCNYTIQYVEGIKNVVVSARNI